MALIGAGPPGGEGGGHISVGAGVGLVRTISPKHVNVRLFLVLQGMACYAGQILAPAEVFFCLSTKKRGFLKTSFGQFWDLFLAFSSLAVLLISNIINFEERNPENQ